MKLFCIHQKMLLIGRGIDSFAAVRVKCKSPREKEVWVSQYGKVFEDKDLLVSVGYCDHCENCEPIEVPKTMKGFFGGVKTE